MPHMSKNILVGSAAFMDAVREVSQTATSRFYVQAMTFEGDDAGEQLIDIMLNCPAADRCLIIDSYSKVVVNDRFVFGPAAIFSPEIAVELKYGKALLKKATDAGIQVVFTNPTGPLLARYPFRNHKKLVIADDVAFIGGINFSDHNFAWHDMMVRFEDAGIAEILSADFNSNRRGQKTSGVYEHDHGHILITNRTQPQPYEVLFNYIRGAQKSIEIFSPYVSNPLLSTLKNELNSDVAIRFFTPQQNNKGIFKKLMLHEAQKQWFELHLYDNGMSHLKAILIDHATLIVGSSNYDFVSYFFEEEIIVTTHQKDLISDFREQVGNHYIANSTRYNPTQNAAISGRFSNRLSAFVLNSAYNVLKTFSR